MIGPYYIYWPLFFRLLEAGLVFRMLLDILEGQALPTSDREQTFAQRFGDEQRQFLKKEGKNGEHKGSFEVVHALPFPPPISSMALFCYTFVLICIQHRYHMTKLLVELLGKI